MNSWEIPQWQQGQPTKPALQQAPWQAMRGDNATPGQALPPARLKSAMQNAYQDSMTQYLAGAPQLPGSTLLRQTQGDSPTQGAADTQSAALFKQLGMPSELAETLGGPRSWKEAGRWGLPGANASNIGGSLGQAAGNKLSEWGIPGGGALSTVSGWTRRVSPEAAWDALAGLF